MRKFWSTLALQLGKRAGLVSVIGLGVTLLLGLGITQLQFSTSQDSYLNKDDQVAIDNRAYQDLFGGELMVSLITMDEGHTVDELTTNPKNYETIQQVAAELRKDPSVQVVATPIDGLRLTDNLVQRDYENPDEVAADPTKSIANVAIQYAIGKEEPGSAAAEGPPGRLHGDRGAPAVVPGRPEEDDHQRAVGRTSCSTTTTGTSARRCRRSTSTTRTPSSSSGSTATPTSTSSRWAPTR